jgi:predicted nucleic acid-binding protein
MSKSFVLDCSITMTWCFEDEFDEYSKFVLQSLKQFEALVPPLWALEVSNVLLITEKHNRLKPADSIRFVELLDSLPIYISDLVFPIPEIINIGRSYKLTSYDAIYLLLAMHKGLSMATKDVALIKACIDNGVPILAKK